jgi:hypothetical protein
MHEVEHCMGKSFPFVVLAWNKRDPAHLIDVPNEYTQLEIKTFKTGSLLENVNSFGFKLLCSGKKTTDVDANENEITY